MSTDALKAGSAESRSWLRRHRLRLSLGIAFVEGIVVALSSDLSRWSVVGIAAVALLLYLALGRSTRWESGHQILWILAFSQALAVVVTIFSFFFVWLAYIGAAILALVVLVMLVSDR